MKVLETNTGEKRSFNLGTGKGFLECKNQKHQEENDHLDFLKTKNFSLKYSHSFDTCTCLKFLQG